MPRGRPLAGPGWPDREAAAEVLRKVNAARPRQEQLDRRFEEAEETRREKRQERLERKAERARQADVMQRQREAARLS